MNHIPKLDLRIDPTEYLLSSSVPWVKYNTLVYLLERRRDDPEVVQSYEDLISHSWIIELIEECKKWPGTPLTRHNDAKHVIHKIALLADFGLKRSDLGIERVAEAILSHQAEDGAFLSNILIPKVFGGDDKPQLSWMLCDTPTLLYALLSFGFTDDGRVMRAVDHLSSLVEENGWRCVGSNPRFRGPGRKDDHCPYANLITLKALSLVPGLHDSDVCRKGIEAQLSHWENRSGRKIYMFGIGTTFKKLKYPNIWYDILHVAEVLSRFTAARDDDRFLEMMNIIYSKQQDDAGFIPESIWRAWKDWSFGQKKQSSPWLTYRIARINRQLNS